MRRALSLWFPAFSTDLILIRRRRRQPQSGSPRERNPSANGREVIVLTRQVGGRELVACRCPHAAAVGIVPGMDLAHARSLVASNVQVHVEPHEVASEQSALQSLAEWALRFSPLAAPDPPDGLLVDITGTQRVHGGESRLIRTVVAGADRLGFRARAATASTFACAWGVARFAPNDRVMVPPGEERAALADLPIAALGVDDSTIDGLREIGITRLAQVFDLPRSSIAARFKPWLLQRMNQALGRANEQIDPVRPQPPPRVELMFDGPTDRWESVEAATHHALEALVAQLIRSSRGVRQMTVRLIRPHAEPQQIDIRLSRPSASGRHLWSLVRTRLERLDLGEGVEGVVLVAVRTAPLRHQQVVDPVLDERADDVTSAAWGELVDTLIARLGGQNAVCIVPVESHLPERTFIEQPVLECAARIAQASVSAADRPISLWPRPERAQVMSLTPDGPVLNVGWRGRRWRVLACSGPERLSAEWWRWSAAGGQAQRDSSTQPRFAARNRKHSPPPDRDYFAVQLETGQWLWMFRHLGTSRWFVHGQWS